MKLSELKDIIEKDLQELGDLEVFTIHKNPLQGAILENVQEVVRVKTPRDNKEPFLCFALSSCTFVPNVEATKDEIQDILKDCSTTY